MELRIGDEVRCIKGDRYLREGAVYVVERYAKPEYPNHSDLVLAGVQGCWSRAHFELVRRPSAPLATTYDQMYQVEAARVGLHPNFEGWLSSDQLEYLAKQQTRDLIESMKVASSFVRYERQSYKGYDIIAPASQPDFRCGGCSTKLPTRDVPDDMAWIQNPRMRAELDRSKPLGVFVFPVPNHGAGGVEAPETARLCASCAEEVARFIKHLATRRDGYDPDVD